MDRHSSGYYDEQDYNIFSQETSYPLTAPSLSTPRVGLQNLDLNSQADGFPHIDSYTKILQPEEGDSEARLPPLPPRSSHGPFQPPRQGCGGRGPGRGACQAASGQGHRNSLNSRAAAGRVPLGSAPSAQFNPPVVGGRVRGTLMLNHPGRASSSSSDLSAHNQWEQADDSVSQLKPWALDDGLELLRQQDATLRTIGKGASKRGSNYSALEDVQLCKSWIHISNDPIIGNDQSGKTYWERIADDFHMNRDFESDRTPNSLEHRFGIILKDCMKFHGFFEEVQHRHPSGVPYQEYLGEAHGRYARSGKKFQFEQCWLTLRNTQKFESTLEVSKRPAKSRELNLSEGTQQENVSTAQGQERSSIPSTKTTRPPGRKQSKDRLKRNEGDDKSQPLRMMQNFLVMKTEEQMMKKERWEKDMLLEERKLKMEEQRLQWEQEQKIMFCDVTAMDNDQRAYLLAKRAKIVKDMTTSTGETVSGESVV